MNKLINIYSFEAYDIITHGKGFKSTFETKSGEIKNRKRNTTLDNCLEVVQFPDIIQNGQTDVLIQVTFDVTHGEYTKEELRKMLYDNGFDFDGKHYIRYKRSCSNSRVGSCLFVQENYYNDMYDWSCCGLNSDKAKAKNLAQWEAYVSLTLSGIIDTIDIKPHNILLIDDYNSVFLDEVMATRQVDGKLITAKETVKISNSIWDGQSLIDTSILGKYNRKGFVQLRNRFFKTAAFNCDIQQFFKDNGITDISQLNGKTTAKNIEDIKLITTPNSVKYLKFGTFEKWIDNICVFGICKYDKPPKNGKYVNTNYQAINTIDLNDKDMQDLIQTDIDFLQALKNDDFFAQEKYIRDNDKVMRTLYQLDWTDTKIYQDFVTRYIIAPYKNRMKIGKIKANGTNATLVGNGYEMLLASIGRFDGTSILPINKVYSTRFEANKELLCVRNPHITMGNLWLVENVACTEIEKYFAKSNEILHINSISSNVLNRLNGADFDGDFCMVSDSATLISAVKKHYDEFLVPTNCVDNKNSKDIKDLAKLDYKSSQNKIGEICNFAQVLNSLYWQGDDISYEDICTLAILSNLEIDAAKKTLPIDTEKALKNIRSKYTIDNKPLFFEDVDKENNEKILKNIEKEIRQKARDEGNKDYKAINEQVKKALKKERQKIKDKYIYIDTPMDRLFCAVNKIRVQHSSPVKTVSIAQKIRSFEATGKSNTAQKRKIIGILDQLQKDMYKSHNPRDLKIEVYHEIQKIIINMNTIKGLITDKESKLLLQMLWGQAYTRNLLMQEWYEIMDFDIGA